MIITLPPGRYYLICDIFKEITIIVGEKSVMNDESEEFRTEINYYSPLQRDNAVNTLTLELRRMAQDRPVLEIRFLL